VDGKCNDADTDAKISHKPVLIYAVIVFTLHDISGFCEFGKCARPHTHIVHLGVAAIVYAYSAHGLFVTIFKHCWLTTGSWKMLMVSLKVLEFFCNQECGNPVINVVGF